MSKETQGAPRGGRRTFTEAFKRDAVALMRQRRRQGHSLRQIGLEVGVRPALLWEWARRLDGGGTGAVRLGAGASEAEESVEEEVRRLRREVAVLREERDFAKKAAADSTGQCNRALLPETDRESNERTDWTTRDVRG